MKLKSLLTFEEIATLSKSTGAQITRLRGKDAPWYEVMLAEPSRDALRKKLFQTGHPVEKMKRVRIGNLELDRLAPGHHRELSPAEVASFSRALQQGFAYRTPARPAPRSSSHARIDQPFPGRNRVRGKRSSPKESH